MYCRHCGAPVPDGANYCQDCGQPLLPEAAPATAPAVSPTASAPAVSSASGQAVSPPAPAVSPAASPAAPEKGSNTVLYLLMAMLALPPLLSELFPMLLLFNEELLSLYLTDLARALAISAVGMLSVLSLVRRGWILPGRLRGQDLLMWLLWSLPAGLVSMLTTVWVGERLGDDAAVGLGMARNAADGFCELYGFWSWALVILLCLARSGRLRLTKKLVVRAGLLLAGWSLLFLVLSGPIFLLTTGGPGSFSWQGYAELTLGLSCATLWVRHGFAAAYMVLYGGGRLPAAAGLLLPAVPALLTGLLTPVLLSFPPLALFGPELARAAAFLVSWVLLLALHGTKAG